MGNGYLLILSQLRIYSDLCYDILECLAWSLWSISSSTFHIHSGFESAQVSPFTSIQFNTYSLILPLFTVYVG